MISETKAWVLRKSSTQLVKMKGRLLASRPFFVETFNICDSV
jgi:hypothetical protein